METGTLKLSNHNLDPCITQQHQQPVLNTSVDTVSISYVPVIWQTANSRENMQMFGKGEGQLCPTKEEKHKQRPISDAGMELQNRWRLRNENGKGGLAQRSLPEPRLLQQV